MRNAPDVVSFNFFQTAHGRGREYGATYSTYNTYLPTYEPRAAGTGCPEPWHPERV